MKHQNWSFTGDFNGFEIPSHLLSLLRWIIIGPKEDIDICPQKKESIDIVIHNIGQIILKAIKTRRQVNYNPLTASFRNLVETPFSVGLALHIHQQTRSKKIIDFLSGLGLSTTYDRIIQIETQIANAVAEKAEQNHGVYVRPNIESGVSIHFAIDNTDFVNNTPDGKHEFHGIGQTIFQKSVPNIQQNHLNIDHSHKTKLKFEYNTFSHLQICHKPTPPNELFPNFSEIIQCKDLDLYNRIDQVWAVSKVMVDEKTAVKFPTWAAYNSLITDAMDITICQGLPLLPGTPTDWSNLYTPLKIVQGISVAVTGNSKTIVSLDLQLLYAKCMQLREKKSVSENFIFRLGERTCCICDA